MTHLCRAAGRRGSRPGGPPAGRALAAPPRRTSHSTRVRGVLLRACCQRVPDGECLTPYERYLILELAHCGLYHRRSSRFSATMAVVRCRPRRNTAPALGQAQTGASSPLPPRALGSLETLSAAPSQRG